MALNGRTYALAANHRAAGEHLKLRAKRFAKSGFASMVRPFSMSRKPQIYLLDPYDPNKTCQFGDYLRVTEGYLRMAESPL